LNYDIDDNSLTSHIFTTGITGSGKSNTCRRILAGLMASDMNFMIIKPAKDEYLQLALAYNHQARFEQEISVYVPGYDS
jgi:DNA helicase HerA-like ATPase